MGEGTREGTAGGGTGGGVTGGSPQVTEWAGMALGGATRRRCWRGGGATRRWDHRGRHQRRGRRGRPPKSLSQEGAP